MPSFVVIMNILSVVNTKQCLLSYFYPSYLSQHKDNPIKASYVVIFYFSHSFPFDHYRPNRLYDMIVTISYNMIQSLSDSLNKIEFETTVNM